MIKADPMNRNMGSLREDQLNASLRVSHSVMLILKRLDIVKPGIRLEIDFDYRRELYENMEIF